MMVIQSGRAPTSELASEEGPTLWYTWIAFYDTLASH